MQIYGHLSAASPVKNVDSNIYACKSTQVQHADRFQALLNTFKSASTLYWHVIKTTTTTLSNCWITYSSLSRKKKKSVSSQTHKSIKCHVLHNHFVHCSKCCSFSLGKNKYSMFFDKIFSFDFFLFRVFSLRHFSFRLLIL